MDKYVNEDVDNANGDEDNEKDLLLDDEAGAFLEKLQQKARRVKKWGKCHHRGLFHLELNFVL